MGDAEKHFVAFFIFILNSDFLMIELLVQLQLCSCNIVICSSDINLVIL